jgi:hypothetical protein
MESDGLSIAERVAKERQAKEIESKRVADESNEEKAREELEAIGFTVTELANLADLAKVRVELREEFRTEIIERDAQQTTRLERIIRTERAAMRREVAQQIREETKLLRAALTITNGGKPAHGLTEDQLQGLQGIINYLHDTAYGPGMYEGNGALQTAHNRLCLWADAVTNPGNAPESENKAPESDENADKMLGDVWRTHHATGG